MSVADFQAVVAAVSAGDAAPPTPVPPVEAVAVLGGGPEALAIAAACLAGGVGVTIWSPFVDELAEVGAAGAVAVRGDDLVGNYATDPESAVHLDLATTLRDALRDADAVFVTGDVGEQRVLAQLLAHQLEPGPFVVVVPGLTFGALELRWWMQTVARSTSNTIVEISDSPWAVTATGPSAIELRSRRPARIAALPAGAGPGVAAALAPLLPPLEQHATVIHTSMSDASGIVDVPGLVLGGAGLQADPESLLPGAQPLPDAPMADTITEPLARIIGRLAGERRQVASKWGVRDIPPDPTWLAGGSADEGGRAPGPVGTVARRLALHRTAGSLVPLASAAATVGVETPTTSALIELVTAMFGFDVSAAGRRLESLGLGRADIDEIRRTVANTAGGG